MRPILFNTEMVRAILSGQKTVTRRVVKPQPTNPRWNQIGWLGWDDGHGRKMRQPYTTGDILYVRETWAVHPCPGKEYFKLSVDTLCEHSDAEHGCFLYKATGYDTLCGTTTAPHKWRPSIHMPREAARIFLRVTGVRVERLQDISECEAKREGAVLPPEAASDPEYADYIGGYYSAFGELWDSTIKPADRAVYGWAANPWVWVIEFDRCEKPDECGN